jgi:hypothetical protein
MALLMSVRLLDFLINRISQRFQWAPNHFAVQFAAFRFDMDIHGLYRQSPAPDPAGILSVGVILYNPDGTHPDTLVTMAASGNTTWLGSNSY